MRILLVADAHANIHALRNVFEHARGYDFVIFIGDSVDYGPHPSEVIDFLREHVDIWVMGNHDNAVAWNVDCSCGEKLHALSVYTRKMISLKKLDKNHINFLQSLPIKRETDIEGVKLYIVHASPRDPLYGYLFPHLPEDKLKEMLVEKTPTGSKPVNCDYLVVGHTHMPMNRNVGPLTIVNPGSVGQPRDGDPRASYAILDTKEDKFEVYRVKYPVEKTIAYIKALNLEKDYEELLIRILTTGSVE
ncbi:MAG: metallophosphoesterase family protein [Candidatus Njordarchaeales archaeon]